MALGCDELFEFVTLRHTFHSIMLCIYFNSNYQQLFTPCQSKEEFIKLKQVFRKLIKLKQVSDQDKESSGFCFERNCEADEHILK